jgi:hypothetical protein
VRHEQGFPFPPSDVHLAPFLALNHARIGFFGVSCAVCGCIKLPLTLPDDFLWLVAFRIWGRLLGRNAAWRFWGGGGGRVDQATPLRLEPFYSSSREVSCTVSGWGFRWLLGDLKT